MAWTESGLYVSTIIGVLTNTPSAAQSTLFTSNLNKFYLTNTSETPNFTTVAASSIYASTNECSGAGWAAGGVAASALGAGATDITMTMTGTTTKIVTWGAQNVSVATTTLPAAYGGYFYANALTVKALLIGIWFGGSGYSTTAGTFAITWAANVIATITCAT